MIPRDLAVKALRLREDVPRERGVNCGAGGDGAGARIGDPVDGFWGVVHASNASDSHTRSCPLPKGTTVCSRRFDERFAVVRGVSRIPLHRRWRSSVVPLEGRVDFLGLVLAFWLWCCQNRGMSRFKVPDRDQAFVEMVSFRDLVGPDEAVWTVIDVVDSFDLSTVYAGYKPVSAGGRKAYDPKMMLTLVLFGYCEGKRTTRELEAACRRDVMYRLITAGMTPDHATIAKFIKLIAGVIEDLFLHVLASCADAGLVKVGRVAVDGTRMAGAGSLDANRSASSLDELETEIRAILDAADQAEALDNAAGVVDSHEPDPAPEPDLDAVSQSESVPQPDPERVSEPESGSGPEPDSDSDGGVLSVRRRVGLEDKLGRVVQAKGAMVDAVERRQVTEKRKGKKNRGEVKVNVTDPESRLQKTRQGWVQGYNAQAVVSEDQIVIAAEVIPKSTDVEMLIPMIDLASENLATVGVTDPVAHVLADAGYWSADNFRFEETSSSMLVIATKNRHTKTKPVNPDRVTAKTRARFVMEQRFGDKSFKELYRCRAPMVEGSFAHTKTQRRTDRFLRVGLDAVNAEWKLTNCAGNLMKLARHKTRQLVAPPPHQPPDATTQPKQGCNRHDISQYRRPSRLNHPKRHHFWQKPRKPTHP